MDRAELIELAAPPCHECGNPVQRLETSWTLGPDDDWVPESFAMVCAEGHRVPVDHFA